MGSKRVALLAGGYTGERDVAIMSGENVAKIFADDKQYRTYLIKVGRDGWFYEEPNGTEKCEVHKDDFSITLANNEKIKFDLAMLLIGGPPGEDGQIQGYLELLNIPYVGCGLLASAITFNKSIANRVVRSFNSSIVHVSLSTDINRSASGSTYDISSLRLPVMVKPVDSGSSLGVSKVNDLSELPAALLNAFVESNQALVEEFIVGREITVGVVRLAGQICVLPITEVVHPTEGVFFDAVTKFIGETGTKMVTPADLSEETKKKVEAGVTELYEKLNLRGLVRIDLMLEQPSNKVFFLEVNAAPSQTEYSLIMQQLAKAGWTGTGLLDFYKQLIQSIS